MKIKALIRKDERLFLLELLGDSESVPTNPDRSGMTMVPGRVMDRLGLADIPLVGHGGVAHNNGQFG